MAKSSSCRVFVILYSFTLESPRILFRIQGIHSMCTHYYVYVLYFIKRMDRYKCNDKYIKVD